MWGRGIGLTGVMALCLPGALAAMPQPVETLWRSGQHAVIVTPCPPGGDHDDGCRAIRVRSGDDEKLAGSGYGQVKILWRGRHRPGAPDVLVFGDDGGSGGNGNLIAVTFTPSIHLEMLRGERMDMAVVRPGRNGPTVDLAFDIEFFNGAPHAGATIVSLPLIWRNDTFDVDLATLRARRFSEADVDFRTMASRWDLHRWARDRYPATRLYPPEAPNGTPLADRALAEMMLSGHADQARVLLREAWPNRLDTGGQGVAGEDAYWAGLCKAIVRHPWWRRFRLDRLPHSDMITAAAATAN